MKPPRIQRIFAALITALSLLFTQLAVAAYACPDLVVETMAAKVMRDAMPGCTGMDMAKPGLCQAHCAGGHQSLDAPVTPYIGAFIATGLVAVLPIRIVFDSELPARVSSTHLARSTAPPLAIRHCCFRF